MNEEFFTKIRMRFTPPSSRSYHTRTDDTMYALGRIEDRLARLEREIEERDQKLASLVVAHDTHSKLYLQNIHCMTGEDPGAAKRRFFAEIPPAEGSMRLYQLANVKLMAALDEICRRNGITYWLCFGALVAAITRSGFIPWDDDIDICLMREELNKLTDALKDDEVYQITTVYDRHVLCKQVRFSAKDEKVPCFIDLCVWDWALSTSHDHDDIMRELRLGLMRELEGKSEDLPYWRENPYLFEGNSGFVVQCGDVDPFLQKRELADPEIGVIQGVFDKYRSMALAEGVLCDKEEAEGIAYGLENLYDVPRRRTIFPRASILPVREIQFEGYSFLAPNRPEDVCDDCYAGWPYLPMDIFAHQHFSKDLIEDRVINQALSDFVGGK